MNFRSALPGRLLIAVLLLATGASAQRGAGAVGGPVLVTPGPTLEAPSDSSLTSQGGLLVDVVGENLHPLDRQAVVKASNKETQKVIYATTGSNAEAGLGALSPGSYELEVSAVGYLTSNLAIKIPDGHVIYKVHVDLKKDPSAIDLNVSTRQEMPVKVRKQMSEGVAALKSGKLKQAQKHLDAADAAFPYNSEIKFLLGYLSFEEKDFKQAEIYLVDAGKFDSHNVQAITLLGRTQLQLHEYESAKKTLEQAIVVNPEYWMAHNLLAETYLKQQEYDKAREQAQLAIEKGRGAASSAHIALGQALENLGRNQEALEAYRTFLKESPSSPMAGEVRIMFDELRRRVMNPTTAAKAASSSRGADVLLAANEVGFSMKAWGPPGIDDVKQPVAEGVACPYDKVIDGAGDRIKQLVDDVGRFNAIEDLLHEDLDELDHPISRTVLKFNYVAAISEPSPGVFHIGEFRDQRSGIEDFPDQIATRGLPALALIFHPDERDDFKMACEGLGDWRGTATWLVRFEQRTDRPPRIQEYRIAGHSYPVSLKGRAWISADSFHLLHVESDLVSPMPEIQLLSEHMAVDYAPQLFQKKSVELWLPKSAEIYFDFRRHHYLRRHSFDHFMLFSVDSDEKRNEPRASKELPNAPVSQ
ncbi:MAG TPA: tetratricopeptide repeat protein [Terriglobales bacterium]|jgi:tetratricopeptide (TPR) repeat protein|nr:tetratricopeptide repeat protein [Terriglobales bacterium]